MPKVSIVIPLYNKEKYILETLRSITSQPFTDYEVIIVNDGSTDNSLNVVKSYCLSFPNILIMDIPNGGVSNARNVGLRHAVGDWVMFLDSDDMIEPLFLKTVFRYPLDSIDIVFSDFTMIDENGCTIKEINSQITGKKDVLKLSNVFCDLQYKNGFFGYISNKLIRRELIVKLGLEFDNGIRLAEDLDFYARLYPHIQNVLFVPEKSFFYVINNSNYINDTNIDYPSQITVFLNIKRWFAQIANYQNNRYLIDLKLSQYVYLSLFSVSENSEQIKHRYHMVVSNPEIMESVNSYLLNGFEKTILRFVERRKLYAIIFLLKCRLHMRKIYRLIKRT